MLRQPEKSIKGKVTLSMIGTDATTQVGRKTWKTNTGRPYHPMTQGKIERYHRSMKNIILLYKYFAPEGLERRISQWVDCYNYDRYHESIDNVTPAYKYSGKAHEVLQRRIRLKQKTMRQRRARDMKGC